MQRLRPALPPPLPGLLLALLLLLLAGCATPVAVRELAGSTGERAADLALMLEQADRAAATARSARAERLARLAAATAASRAGLEQEMTLAARLGGRALTGTYAMLQQLAAADPPFVLPPAEAAAGLAVETATTAGLRALAAQLMELAGDGGAPGRLGSLVGFVDEVDRDLIEAAAPTTTIAAAAATGAGER